MIEVEIEIYDEILKVRDRGITNMFDIPVVRSLVNDNTKEWIRDNKELYSKGIMFGFKVIVDTIS